MANKDFRLSSTNRMIWLQSISQEVLCFNKTDKYDIYFPERCSDSTIKPFHLVSLSCLIEKYYKEGTHVTIWVNNDSENLYTHLKTILHFDTYWPWPKSSEVHNYTKPEDDSIFNLWRINEKGKEFHSEKITTYLRTRYFKNKDLSAVKNCLDELYYNIFDHADCDGTAFSFIKFDKETEVIQVAVCDFGKGVAKSIRDYFDDINNDNEAISKALEDSVTTQSQKHNRGYGFSNILSSLSDNDYFRIVSNNGCIVVNGDKQREINDIPFYFNGTIIDFEISLSHFADEEINDTFAI